MGGKSGSIIFNDNQSLGDVLAPPVLTGVPDAYAIYFAGDSMKERYRDGEVGYIHPTAPVRKGDGVVVQIEGKNGEREGLVKEFVSRDSKHLKLRQYNPKKIITIPISRVHSVHKIIMAGAI